MPMLDAYIPDGALPADVERALLGTLTDLLLQHEGADPLNPAARALAKVWLHRPTAVLHAGEQPAAPHYRVIASVPEGQFDDERRASMVAAVTDAILAAEGGRYDADPLRVWVFANEIPEGTWGGGGRIARLADIAGLVLGDPEAGRAYAARRLASRAVG
ncbi:MULTISPECIES: tautomerase family protein [unclassified Mycobacterium]|uniref:tautomerase family protein n=1 Tax=unclassified Mycobacterium TaxID=2642494 RepID=UPI0029C7AF7D|nr:MULTISPECIES: 4-oxalocrotonate tautomerase [unclassified Mycobacterium]